MVNNITIANHKIGPGHRPFIVAEMSGNHGGSLERALDIVKAAKKAGAHALKLQTYTADTITLDVREKDFVINQSDRGFEDITLYDLYEKASTPWEWHKPVYDLCRELGIICFSAPFDESAVDFLESLDTPCYKIASFENVHIPLIKKVAGTGKPIIMSTGMATKDELEEAVETAREAGCKEIALLKCTSVYPADPADANLLTLPDMIDTFGVPVGLSDHTMGTCVAIASVAMGASIIEKHFTLSRSGAGVDSSFSIEPDELASLVDESERAWKALGKVHYGPVGKEAESVKFRRSIYIAEDMEPGELFTGDNVRVVRPGFGLAPKYFDKILGQKISTKAKKGTPLSWELIAK